MTEEYAQQRRAERARGLDVLEPPHDPQLRERFVQEAQIGGRIEQRLPASAASVTVLRSRQLKTAQDTARVLDDLPIVLTALSLALFACALLAAPGYRRNAVRGYGMGLAAAGCQATVCPFCAT